MPPAALPYSTGTATLPLLLLHAAFVLTGVVTTLLGPVLPILVGRWGLDDWQAGLLFTLQFVGSIGGVTASSAGMSRLGFRTTLVAGIACMAAGVAPLALDLRALGFASVFGYGIGLGLTIPATNLAVAEWQPARRAAALNVLNLAWGIGAVSAPPVVALFHRAGRADLFLLALAAALALMALALLAVALPDAGAPDPVAAAHQHERPRWTSPGVLLFGTLLFVYVGTETALGGWVAVYAQRMGTMPASVALAAPSLFWAALLVGRGVAPIILRSFREIPLLGASVVLAGAGVVALLAAGSAGTLAFAVSICGLGLATIFPTTMALFSQEYGRDATRLAAPVFVLAGLGGASLPPLVGVVSTKTGSLGVGLAVPLAGCAAMLALLRILARRTAASGG